MMIEKNRNLRILEEFSSPTQAVQLRDGNIRRLLPALAMFMGFAGILSVLMAVLTGVWQNLAIATELFLMALVLAYARRLVHRDHVSTAAYLILGVILVSFPVTALFWQNVVWLLCVGALGLTNLLAFLVLLPSERLWAFLLSVLSAVVVLVLDALSWPWARFDVSHVLWMTLFAYGLLGSVLLFSLAQLVYAYRRVATIRTRLTIIFVLVVMLVTVAVNVSSIVFSMTNAQRQAMNELRAISELKQETLQMWLDSLQADLNALIVEGYELERARSLLMDAYTIDYRVEARQTLFSRFQQVVERTRAFDELFLITLDGEVVLSSDTRQEGKRLRYQDYFQHGMQEPYIDAPRYYPSLGKMSIVATRPVIDQYGDTLGILAGRVNMSRLNELMSQVVLGETGETYLVAQNHTMLSDSRFGTYAYIYSEGINNALSGKTDSAVYRNYRGVSTVGFYMWMPDLKMAVLSEIARSEVLAGTRTSIWVNVGVALGASVLAIVISVFLARDISVPLSELAQTATRIASGEQQLVARVEREDEIGMLARAFNSMTEQLRESIESLEQRVEARTRGLETVAGVSRATTSVLDPERLLPRVVNLVRESFDLYYVGLFLVNDVGTDAILRAGTGEAGQQMIAQGWSLSIGGKSMIGQCVATGSAGVRQTEGDVVVRFENPFLPETRSELALPLRYGQDVIGAMTVQSVEESAFDATYIALLQNMADQVAVAVQNARLFAETQAALKRTQEVQDRYQGQAWREYMHTRRVSGYERQEGEVRPLGRELLPEAARALDTPSPVVEERTLLVPIIQAGKTVGVLGFEGLGEQRAWSADQVALIESLAEQLVLAAENQRLIDETQRRAARERLTREITDNIRAAVSIEDAVRRAIRETVRALDASEVVAHLGTERVLLSGGEVERDE